MGRETLKDNFSLAPASRELFYWRFSLTDTYLLLESIQSKLYGPIPNDNLANAERFFKSRGYRTTRIHSLPANEDLEKWKETNYAEAIDGCKVWGWNSCKHHKPSWLKILRGVK